MRTTTTAVTALLAATALTLTACSGSDEAGGGDAPLTIWTTEDVTDRVAAQQEILDRYTAETGTQVELVPVASDDLPTVLASSAASGELPDAIAAASLSSIYQFAIDDLLDTEAAAAVVEDLGAGTFNPRALELTSSEGEQLAVPSDGWAQLLYYRTDLFEQAGLEPPTTLQGVQEAAAALQSDDVAGITLATAPGDGFTQETFEHLALANGCELVTGDAVSLDTPQCTEALEITATLARDYSVAGNQDVDTTRATYFAGDAAMVIWSSFLLDELAGLRDDALPTCEECGDDPTYLAENTGVVSALSGPGGTQPAAFGEIVSWAIMDDSDPATQDLVTWMMDAGYPDWLSIAPEGKVPVRNGTEAEPTVFADSWQDLEAGVDTTAPLSELYPPEVLQAVVEAPDGFDRWGIPDGYGQLAGAVSGQLIVPRALSEMVNGGLTAADAAARIQDEASTVKEDLGL